MALHMYKFPPKHHALALGETIEYVTAGSGPANVVLVNGSGGPIEGWHKVFGSIAGYSRVLAYNRPGIGGSSKPRIPQIGSHMVASLRAVLHASGFQPPYVLVGHSLGGLIVNLFARLHPSEVSAAVLLEATAVRDIEVLSKHEHALQRLVGVVLEKLVPTDPNAESRHVSTTASELIAAPAFPRIPLVVITGGKPAMAWATAPRVSAARAAHQQELVPLSPLGKQVIAARSGHFPQFSEPELVVAAVKELANPSFLPTALEMNMKEESFTGRFGTRIHMRSWRPAAPRAIVVICHGVNSHSGQYLWSGEQLSGAGISVYAYDHRGRGQSEGPRFYVDVVSDYTKDLGTLIALAKSREPGLKVFLLGHSAGGVVGCTWSLDHQQEIAGFICESFAYRVPAPAPMLALVRLFGRVAPKLPVLKLKMKDFTRDPAALAALVADPYTRGEVQPARTVAALLKATDRMTREFPTLKLPLLILHGTADKATMPAGSQFFYDTAGSRDKTLKLYQDHYHDLLNDTGKEKVMGDVVAWINARLT